MQVPGTMTTPKMKLEDGEEVIKVQQGLRRKGIFGNRYGELYITNKRVAFVKAIMKAGIISAAANKLGAKPILSFERGAITGVEKVQMKKQTALVITAGAQSEKFMIVPEAIDDLIAAIKPSA